MTILLGCIAAGSAALAAGAGARQIYFKYCSTFDSAPAGNIGPVTEALMEALGCDFTIATPAFPDNKRTVFKGYLFAGDVLLNESGMQNHPLTPMTDANLVRVLQAQRRRKVGAHRQCRGRAWRTGDRGTHRAVEGRRDRHRHRRCGFERRPAAPGPGAGAHAAGHGRFGRGDRATAELRHRAIGRRERAAGGGRAAGRQHACRALRPSRSSRAWWRPRTARPACASTTSTPSRRST